MFDLSFWEILVIGIIAVIIVGPERLPGMAYSAGKWITKVKRFISNAKAEMESEFNTAELRQMLNAQEEEMQKLRKLMEDTRHDVEQSQHLLTQSVEEAAQAVREAGKPVSSQAATATAKLAEEPTATDPTPPLAAPNPATTDASAPAPTVVSTDAPLRVATHDSVEDEMQALSQSLGETLHRPNFGGSTPDTPEPAAPPKSAA